MRSFSLIRKPMVLLAVLVALFAFGGGSGTTYAASTTISPESTRIVFRQGAWNDSGATLSATIDKSQNSILITDDTVLCNQCEIKVDSELMFIVSLTDVAPFPHGSMLVYRGFGGSTKTAHGSGTKVRAQTVTADIYAFNVTDDWGLGGFQLQVGFPPEQDLRYVKLTADPAWLGSTGRMVLCDSFENGGNVWQISCSSTGNPGDSGHPLGPKGSGRIASLTVRVQASMGTRTVSIVGGLVNTTSADILPLTVNNLNVEVQSCPDADLNGKVDSGDLGLISRNFLDLGQDSGVTLVNDIGSSETSVAISGGPGSLVTGDTIAIDTEQMTVVTVQTGTMTVTRGVNYTRTASHTAGARIYEATGGGGDGVKGYTRPRDVDQNNKIDSGDLGIVSRTMVTTCPAP